MLDRKSKLQLTRFIELVERALFELKMANDVAAHAQLGVPVTRPLNSARRDLNESLRQVQQARTTAHELTDA